LVPNYVIVPPADFTSDFLIDNLSSEISLADFRMQAADHLRNAEESGIAATEIAVTILM
jgi:hypothetical protein